MTEEKSVVLTELPIEELSAEEIEKVAGGFYADGQLLA